MIRDATCLAPGILIADEMRSAHLARACDDRWSTPARPARPEGTEPSVAGGRRLPPLPILKGSTILVLEDNPDSRELLRQILESLGARVLLAADGEEGLRLLSGRRPPDLILCDLLMPKLDGYGFIHGIRRDARLTRVPVVAVTGLGHGSDLNRTWLAGFDGHVTKPIDYDTIASVAERVLKRKLADHDP